MTDAAVIGAGVFLIAVITLTVLVGLLLHWLHDMAEDRERERRYADEWIAAHRAHQRDDRYTTERDGAPE